MGRPSRYPAEFRREAVELVRTSGRPVAEVARSLDISDATLCNWVKADREAAERASDPTSLTESNAPSCVGCARSPGGSFSPAAVSCATPTSCIAVGSSRDMNGLAKAAIESWNGVSWFQQSVPSFSLRPSVTIGPVWCSSASFCMTTGRSDSTVKGVIGHQIAMTSGGTSWTLTHNPKDQWGHFDAISCPASTQCAGINDVDRAHLTSRIHPGP